MNILLISYVFPPFGGAGVQRISKLAEYLVNQGHKVSVLTYNHEGSLNKDDDLLSSALIKVKVLMTSFFKYKDNLDINIEPAVFKFVDQENIQVILSSSPTMEAHYLASHLKMICGAFWIADFRDIMSEYVSPFNYFNWRNIKKKEAKVMNYCDTILVISQYHKEYIYRQYSIVKDKIIVVMNGYDKSDFENLEVTQEKNIHHHHAKYLTLVHVGTFYGRRSPLSLIINSLIERKRHHVNIKLQLIGKMGTSAQLIIRFFKQFLSIEVISIIPHHKAIQAMIDADILILVPGRFGVGVMTGKVFEYIASGRPILNLYSFKGPLTELLSEVSGAFNVYEFNIKQFSNAIRVLSSNEDKHSYKRTDMSQFGRYSQYGHINSLLKKIENDIVS